MVINTGDIWGGGVAPADCKHRDEAAMTTAQWGQQVWLTANGKEPPSCSKTTDRSAEKRQTMQPQVQAVR